MKRTVVAWIATVHVRRRINEMRLLDKALLVHTVPKRFSEIFAPFSVLALGRWDENRQSM